MVYGMAVPAARLVDMQHVCIMTTVYARTRDTCNCYSKKYGSANKGHRRREDEACKTYCTKRLRACCMWPKEPHHPELSIERQRLHLTVPTNLFFLSNDPTLRGFS